MGRRILVKDVKPGQVIIHNNNDETNPLFCTQFLTSEHNIGQVYWIDTANSKQRSVNDRLLKVFINENGLATSLPMTTEVELIENTNASN